jgi:hypothetical protein
LPAPAHPRSCTSLAGIVDAPPVSERSACILRHTNEEAAMSVRLWTMGSAVALAVMVGTLDVSARQSNMPGERYVAAAVSMGDVVRPGASTVEMAVERWSSEAEAQRLMEVLLSKGPDRMLDTLRELRRVGYIRTPGNIGYDLRFARKTPMEDGGERVVLATDRSISFWEQWARPRTIDYPFTVIEMRIGKDGTGEGKLSLATRIEVDKRRNQIVLENYGTQPVLLTQVKREPLNSGR